MAVERKYNLPSKEVTDSSEEVRNFFDKFFLHQITFPSRVADLLKENIKLLMPTNM